MRSYEAKAKTMEEAISMGLAQLGASLADVNIEVLDEGKKGVLGILGSKPYVVRLTMKDDDVEEPVATEEKKPVEKTEAAPVVAPVAEKAVAAVAEAVETLQAEKPVFDPESAEGKAYDFLTNITEKMGVKVSVNIHRDEEGNVRAEMFGDSLGILIGRRGETLDALQYLTSLYINRGQAEYTRITLDNENYRAKREEALRRLANRMANRAVKTGRKVVMEPMNPYERRILHSALQQNDAVTTHSEGEEPNRHVVITLKQQA